MDVPLLEGDIAISYVSCDFSKDGVYKAGLLFAEYVPSGLNRFIDNGMLSGFGAVDKLISRDYNELFEGKDESRVVEVGGVKIGGSEPVFIAGPCAIESKAQLFRIAEEVREAGAQVLRGGIFKPRTSVHSFQGLGAGGDEDAREALSWLKKAGQKFEMPVMT